MATPTAKAKVALVDDDAQARQVLAAPLRGDYEVLEAADHDGAYRLLREQEPDMLLLDLNLPSGSVRECVALLNDLTQSDLDTLVIVLSDDRSKETALKVMDAGAYDYLMKTAEPTLVRTIVDRAVEKVGISRENRILREELHRKDAMGDLLGSTDAMRALFESIELDRSSGLKVLDDAAFRIVRMASPYASFPADIRRDTDLLVITRTWFFGRGDRLWTE